MVTSNSSKPLSVYTSVHRVQSGTKLTLQCMHLAKNEHYTDQVTAEVTEWQNALPYWLQIVVKQCKTVRIFVWEQRWHVFARLWVNNVFTIKRPGWHHSNKVFSTYIVRCCVKIRLVGKNELFVNCCTSKVQFSRHNEPKIIAVCSILKIVRSFIFTTLVQVTFSKMLVNAIFHTVKCCFFNLFHY